MSTSIDQSFVRQYERDVHEAFQRRGSFLLQTVRRKPGVKGRSTTFQKVGKGVATTKARHGTITPMNQTHTAIECVLEDFYAGDWVDKLDEAKANHDERLVIANGGAWALGRKADEQILTQLDAALGSPDVTVAFTSSQHVLSGLLQLVEKLNDNDVPNDGQRYGLLTPRLWSAAMTAEEFASADFVGDQPFLKGAEPRTWLGVHWLVHTGLPNKGTNVAKSFVYHRTAIGYGSGVEITADITWHGDRAAHFVNHMMSGGACLIDADGVAEGQSDDTLAIPTLESSA